MELKSEEEKREEGEETHCIICAETFEGDWIQCRIYEGWSHENCSDLEGNNLFYEGPHTRRILVELDSELGQFNTTPPSLELMWLLSGLA
ncbi:hypothetical protein AVEN_85544-1 [Araneus ventricosus]|uniref:Uncharacterized protein n=1 Tax=Araneus ventricosus TaxID=182803 RepID=A0A4Y2LLH1_ARAVE|nr:hypothetical protein AVEN_85544-1 [Araneus ventricosus]